MASGLKALPVPLMESGHVLEMTFEPTVSATATTISIGGFCGLPFQIGDIIRMQWDGEDRVYKITDQTLSEHFELSTQLEPFA